MFMGKINKDAILDLIWNDLDIEMAIREKVEEIGKEVIGNMVSGLPSQSTVPTYETPEERAVGGVMEVSERIQMYQEQLKEQYEQEEKEYYYLKGKGISTEVNDINFKSLSDDIKEKQLLSSLLLEIFG